MKTKNNIIITITTILFICSIMQLKAVEWNKYQWVESEITPVKFKDGYWLELHFLPDDPKYGFACGHFVNQYGMYGNGIFAKTKDSGKTWQAMELGEYMHCESVHFVDTLTGYISGPNFLMKTTDGGNTWNYADVPITDGSIWGNWVIGDTVWIMFGDCNTTTQYVLRSIDGGDTWTTKTLTTDNNDHFTDITILNNGRGYIIGSLYIWTTNDFGETWWKLNKTKEMNLWGGVTSPSNWHEDIAFKDSMFCIPYSQGCNGSGNVGAFAYSSDYGRTWNSILYTETPNFGTAMLDDGTAFGCGVGGNLYMTTDQGNSWTTYNCGVENYDLDDIYFTNDSTGYVCGGGVIAYLELKDYQLSVSGELKKCSNELTTISPEVQYNNYIWYQIIDGDTIEISKETIAQLDTGTYFVLGYDSKCKTAISDEFTISNYDIGKIDIYSDKDEYCEGEIAKIWLDITKLNINNIDTYSIEWYIINDNDTTLLDSNITEIELATYIGLSGFVTLNHESGCKNIISYNFPVYPLIKPILKVDGKAQLCSDQETKIILLNADQYKNITWYKDNKIFANDIYELIVSESGNYFVICGVNALCLSNSDTIPISKINLSDALTFEIDSLFIDSVNYGRMATNELKITNISDNIVTLTNIYLKYKIAYTIKISQLPLTIHPHTSEIIQIFYTPKSIGWEYDTMVISDFCNDHEIPLSGFGKSNLDSTRSSCNVLINISTQNIVLPVLIKLSSPVPNPAIQKTSINWTIESGSETNLDFNEIDMNFEIFLYDYMGNKLNNNFISHNLMSNTGTIVVDLFDYPKGVYFIKIKIEDNYKIFPIVKN